MKVIIIDSLIGNDYTVCLANGLSHAGAKVYMIVPENREEGSECGVIYKKWLPSKKKDESKLKKILNYFKFLYKLYSLILSEKPDAVHLQFVRFKIDYLVFISLKLFGKKLIYTAHNVLPHEQNKIDRFILNVLYRSVNKILVHSGFIKTKLLKEFNLNEQKVKVIPHGNFNHYLTENDCSDISYKQKFGFKETDRVLLFFGYIREYKGLDVLLKAFELLNDENYKLIIAGAPYNESLKQNYLSVIYSMKYKHSIIPDFKFIPKEELNNYLNAADVIILPYKNIDHSGIIHLAYSFSKPVIASAVGDFPESVEEKSTGLIFEPGNHVMLAEKIKDLFNMDYKKMGAYSKKLSDSVYSWDKIATQLIEEYK